MNPMKGVMKAKGYNGFICDRLLINSQRHNFGSLQKKIKIACSISAVNTFT